MESDNDKTTAESSEEEKYEPKNTSRKPLNKKRRSIAWSFCDRENESVASCKICKLKMSYRSTVSNLTKHVRAKHPEFYHQVCNDSKTGNGPENISADVTSASDIWETYEETKKRRKMTSQDVNFDNSASDNTIWRYFTQLDKSLNKASCNMCTKHIIYTTQYDLFEHIKKKHNDQYIPERNVTLIVTDDDELFEVETVDNHREETLDDTDHIQNARNDGYSSTTTSDDSTLQKTRKRFSSTQKNKKTQSDIPITNSRKSTSVVPDVPETTLDYFGKYLMSLLKELPQQVSNKLQADFVRQAIEAKPIDIAPICAKTSVVPQSVPNINIPFTNETEVRSECNE